MGPGIDKVGSNLTRRDFFGLLGSAALFLGLGGLVRFAGRNERPVRPPGAMAEEEFLARCLRCQRCTEVCPTGVIIQGIVAESVLGLGTPRLSFRQGYCTLCWKCAQVCPTGALDYERAQKIPLGIARIDTANCIAWNLDGCTECYQICPKSAIALDSHQRPVVDPGRCTGCGQCEYECPSSYLRSGRETGGKGIAVVSLPSQAARPALGTLLVPEPARDDFPRRLV